MDNQPTTFQQLLSHQIKIRDLQGRWRRVSSLSETEIEQLWNETAREIRGKETFKEPANEHSNTE